MREEGLKEILGVPLKMNGREAGVLFAANRRERPFSHSEVALLSSLATVFVKLQLAISRPYR